MLDVGWIWGMNFERFEGCWRSGLQWDEGGGNADFWQWKRVDFWVLSGWGFHTGEGGGSGMLEGVFSGPCYYGFYWFLVCRFGGN